MANEKRLIDAKIAIFMPTEMMGISGTTAPTAAQRWTEGKRMRGKIHTTRVCMFGKCGSCTHAHYTSTKYPCAIECDLMNPKNSLFQRTRAACTMYQFDSAKVCACGETKEAWYNFCPTCGAFIGERKDNE